MAAGGGAPRIARRVGLCRGGGGLVDLAGERVELGLGLGELDLQLRRVDALGLGDVDTPAQKLQLLLELLVGSPQLVALGGHLGECLLRRRECGLELRDAGRELLRVKLLARKHGRACNHGRDPCRSPS